MKYEKYRLALLERSTQTNDMHSAGKGQIPENELISWMLQLSPIDYAYFCFSMMLMADSFYNNSKTREELNESTVTN